MSFSLSQIYIKSNKKLGTVFAMVSDASWLLSLSTNTGIIYLYTLNCWQSTGEIFGKFNWKKKVQSWRISIRNSQKWSVVLEKPLGRCARIRRPRIQIGVTFHSKYITLDILAFIYQIISVLIYVWYIASY